jgi:cytochrome c biogenesis protein CcmG/thiol:disulfide interchange protein DsbE
MPTEGSVEAPRGSDTSRPGRLRRSKAGKVGLAAVAAALVAGSIVAALSFSSSTPNIPLLDLPVPSFSLQNLVRGGPDISAAGLRRGQAVVVNFWGSWCPPCAEEMPARQAVHRQLGDQVTFVGIDEEDTRPAALDFLRHVGVTYPSGFDGNGSVAQDDFHINGTPTTHFIGHGKMLDFQQGRLTKAQLLDDVKKIFGVS